MNPVLRFLKREWPTLVALGLVAAGSYTIYLMRKRRSETVEVLEKAGTDDGESEPPSGDTDSPSDLGEENTVHNPFHRDVPEGARLVIPGASGPDLIEFTRQHRREGEAYDKFFAAVERGEDIYKEHTDDVPEKETSSLGEEGEVYMGDDDPDEMYWPSSSEVEPNTFMIDDGPVSLLHRREYEAIAGKYEHLALTWFPNDDYITGFNPEVNKVIFDSLQDLLEEKKPEGPEVHVLYDSPKDGRQIVDVHISEIGFDEAYDNFFYDRQAKMKQEMGV